jgi:hypothetical protein
LNQGVQAGRQVLAKRPYVIVKNKERICVLIGVAVPSHRNVILKEAKNKLQYKM